MNLSQKARGEHDGASGRKPYMKPQMQIYGDLREITQTVGENMAPDGGMATGMTRTSP
jgi:hypothetical protein